MVLGAVLGVLLGTWLSPGRKGSARRLQELSPLCRDLPLAGSLEWHKVAAMSTRTSPSSAPLVLHYTLRQSALGQVLVAATPKGIAAVLLGDSKSALISDLQQRYPKAQLDTGGPLLHRWSDTVLEILEHPTLQHVVPLDVVGGTAFQRKVWKALRSIPPGQTRTYTELAKAAGQPQAVRAVASACAANPLAVLVPCHRVLRSDGGWGGYRWGLERKQQLLQQEGAI